MNRENKIDDDDDDPQLVPCFVFYFAYNNK